ncbi:MAG: hypothetical protein B6I26_01145 [Desulfobacteraceae bacterium 4572_130]|nr:MAG: hypothetical protein B6I26_01145 [Desulfobacteraceae bacterium 4572_130]
MNISKKKLFIFTILFVVLNHVAIIQCFAGNSNNFPQRVISLGPNITKLIYLINSQDKLIGITTHCVLPIKEKNKEKIGNVIQINVEKIISLKPDLVFSTPLSRQKSIETLKKQGISIIKFENPENFEQICQMLKKIGKIFNKNKTAQNIIEKSKKQVLAIKRKTKNLKKKKVFIQIGIKPLWTSGKNTFINEYIEFAGGINIAENTKKGIYSREKVIQANPDIIFITGMEKSKKAAENEKTNWLKFKSINASKNNNIYILDTNIVCSPTPMTFVKGLQNFLKFIHPEITLE